MSKTEDWCQDWKQNFKVQANQLPFSPQPNWSSYSALSLLFRTFFITITAVVVSSVQTDALLFIRSLKMLTTGIKKCPNSILGKKNEKLSRVTCFRQACPHLTYKLALQLSEIGTPISPVFTHHHHLIGFQSRSSFPVQGAKLFNTHSVFKYSVLVL